MDRISRELAGFRHEADEHFAEVNRRLHAVEESVSRLHGTFSKMLDKLEVEFRFLYAERDEAEKRFAAIESRVDALEKKAG